MKTQGIEETLYTVGAMAPSFSLLNSQGQQVEMDTELERHGLVVVFYRGFW